MPATLFDRLETAAFIKSYKERLPKLINGRIEANDQKDSYTCFVTYDGTKTISFKLFSPLAIKRGPKRKIFFEANLNKNTFFSGFMPHLSRCSINPHYKTCIQTLFDWMCLYTHLAPPKELRLPYIAGALITFHLGMLFLANTRERLETMLSEVQKSLEAHEPIDEEIKEKLNEPWVKRALRLNCDKAGLYAFLNARIEEERKQWIVAEENYMKALSIYPEKRFCILQRLIIVYSVLIQVGLGSEDNKRKRSDVVKWSQHMPEYQTYNGYLSTQLDNIIALLKENDAIKKAHQQFLALSWDAYCEQAHPHLHISYLQLRGFFLLLGLKPIQEGVSDFESCFKQGEFDINQADLLYKKYQGLDIEENAHLIDWVSHDTYEKHDEETNRYFCHLI